MRSCPTRAAKGSRRWADVKCAPKLPGAGAESSDVSGRTYAAPCPATIKAGGLRRSDLQSRSSSGLTCLEGRCTVRVREVVESSGQLCQLMQSFGVNDLSTYAPSSAFHTGATARSA